MTPELQSVVDRLESYERSNRNLRTLATLALLVGGAALVAALVLPGMRTPITAPIPGGGVVEASKFLLRDAEGRLRGGMEVERTGTVKLVLGNQDGRSGAAMLAAQPNGVVQLVLRGPTGNTRAAIIGTAEPTLAITADDLRSSAALVTRAGTPGSLLLSDRQGTLRPVP